MIYYIYFLKNGGGINPSIKIGITHSLNTRIKELQTGNPRELILIDYFTIETKSAAYAAEAYLHRRFAKQIIRGEWYHGDIDLNKLFKSIELRGLKLAGKYQLIT